MHGRVEEIRTDVEVHINAASAGRDILADENAVDIVGGTVRVGRVDIFQYY
jgi:hypothetical protein